jgi:hypothetical protein
LCLAAAAAAQTPRTPPANGAAQAQKAEKKAKLFGTVRSVDLASWNIVVRTERGGTRRVAISAGTKLDKGSRHKAISIADLRSGDPLTIIMQGKVVRSVHVYLASK